MHEYTKFINACICMMAHSGDKGNAFSTKRLLMSSTLSYDTDYSGVTNIGLDQAVAPSSCNTRTQYAVV